MSDFTIINENRDKGLDKALVEKVAFGVKLIWGDFAVFFPIGDEAENFLESVNLDYSDLPSEVSVMAIDEYFLTDTVEDLRIKND